MGFHTYNNDVPSRTHTLWKSLGYRVYATTVTTLIALFIFKPSVVFGTASLFFLMDILGGMVTYYTFERFWYWLGLQ